jgi:hypothetical protein
MKRVRCGDSARGAAQLPLLAAAAINRRRSALVSVAIAATLCGFRPSALADGGDPTSSRAARDEAVRAIPWRAMGTDERRTAQFVIKNTSIYRRLPTRVIDCDPEMFNFLFQHPEVVIDVWRVMGISQVALEKLPSGVYRGTDGAGTTGVVRFLHTNFGPNAKNVAVIFADGTYEGKPFVTPLKAQSILLLRSSAVQETNGRHYVTVCVDSFVRIDQMGIEGCSGWPRDWRRLTTRHGTSW